MQKGLQAYINLLILSINIIMIRQKRCSLSRNSQNITKAYTSDPNTQNLKPQDEKIQPFQGRKCSLNESRTGLSQFVANGSARESIVLKVLGVDNKFQPQNPPKHKENIFAKISQLIKIQDIPMPICHSNRTKHLRCFRQRPLTSFSQINKIAIDQTQLHKCSVVLDLSKNYEILPPEKSSTSRALMNYSKVFRNNSKEGCFRVKKNMSFMNKYVHLAAQKVVFQQKSKRQKSLERTVVLRKATISKKAQQRYKQQQQDFEIGGWEYFQ